MIVKSGSHENNQGNTRIKTEQKVKTQKKKKFFSVGRLRNASKDIGRMSGGTRMKEKSRNAGGKRHKRRREVNVRLHK